MDDILRLLGSHRSIRKYKADSIDDSLLDNILNSARQAPTSSNLQAYSLIVVKDPEKKKTLSHLCGDQPWVGSCPVFIAICPDLHRLDQVCKIRDYKMVDQYIELLIMAIVDASLVAENILVAAEGSGLGGCMIGAIRNNPADVCTLLKLPEKVFPLVGLCLGYPDQEPMIKPRLMSQAVIHHEHYGESNLADLIKEYDRIVKATGLYDGPSRKVVSPDSRAVSDDDYSWGEHIARRLASTDPRATRAHMRRFLESRGFGME
jgi:nitroreductase